MFLNTLTLVGLVASTAFAHPGAEIFARQACNSNNCLRGVRAQSAIGSADCSSFLRTTLIGCGGAATVSSTTVVVSTAFTTVTTTVGGIPTGPGGPAKRQAPCSTSTVIPSATPNYASVCSSAAAYASACSCISVSGSTTTVSAGSGTTTVVRTSTSVTSSVAVVTVQPSSGTFQLVLPGGRRVVVRSSDGALTASNSGGATTFFLNGVAELQVSGTSQRAGVYAVTGKDTVYALVPPAGFTTLKCTLSNPKNSNGALVCSAGGNEKFPVLCNDVLFYSNTRDQAGCAAVDLQAVN